MLRHESRPVETIDNVQFVEMSDSDFSPLVSKCTIKLVYVGQNRNGSFMSKDTLIKMAPTVRACPIVGYYREDIEDFGDHGHVITIEDGEIKFNVKTRPYGFVAPDARVWFQKFTDIDDFGNEVEHEYMMTTGYLWTGQFPEAQQVIDEGKGQSVELDEETLDGHWANDSKSGMDFFIINDAVFSKLCILGDDVEPCFEGASVTAGVESNYAEDTEFAHTLYTMIKQLQEIVGANEGGVIMPEQEALEEVKVVTDFVAGSGDTKDTKTDTKDSKAEKEDKAPSEEKAEPATEHVAQDKEDEQKTEEVAAEEEKKEEQTDAKKRECALEEEDKKDEKPEVDAKKRECALDEPAAETVAAPVVEATAAEVEEASVSSTFALEEENKELRAELEALREFKRSIENKEKDELIAKYHMLSDEDKADIIAHKEEYTLEQIDEKLAFIYVRNNVDFSTVDGQQESEDTDVNSLLSFSLDDSKDAEVVSDIQAAFRSMEN